MGIIVSGAPSGISENVFYLISQVPQVPLRTSRGARQPLEALFGKMAAESVERARSQGQGKDAAVDN